MKIRYCLLIIGMMLGVSVAIAQLPIEGNWVTNDEKTGEKRAVLQLAIQDGVLNGKVAKVYPQDGDSGVCSKCPGQFKDKKILGLQIIWGLKEKRPNAWNNGYILDAESGKIYRVKMTVKRNKLYVRGYYGVALLGRTQIWDREQVD